MKKGKKSKFFRIASEGATTDGRKISRAWLEQMAANYDPTKYGARVNLEHLRGILPDGPFKAYGDVLALKTEEADGKLHLLAQLDPTDDLIALNQKRQKVYTSMEVDPNFADSGEAYLVGLAVTDSPASLGTEMLQFSAQQGDKSPLAGRKQKADNLFTVAVETELEFNDTEAEDEPTDKPSLLDSVKALFTKYRKAGKDEINDFREDLEETLELFVQDSTTLRTELTAAHQQLQEEFTAFIAQFDQLQQEFTTLREQLDNEPDTPSRSSATGGTGGTVTDC